MKIKRHSSFRSPADDIAWFNAWVDKLEKLNAKQYGRQIIETSLGKTHIYTLNESLASRPALIIFPGARTTSLIWDFENNLKLLGNSCRIYLVETNGLPNLSDGNTPEIRSKGYGKWAEEILNGLELREAIIAGASFGGLVALKLGIVAPQRMKAAILLNPGGLQRFSLKWKNLYHNILPIISPTSKNIEKFLNVAIFHSPHHQLQSEYFQLLVAYQKFALSRYKDNTQKPYYMGRELKEVEAEVYLLEGNEDILFPASKSISNARKYLQHLQNVEVFKEVGHGIETYKGAIASMAGIIRNVS